jgi:hypothetical protein
MSRFDYVKYNEAAATLQAAFKQKFVELDEALGALEESRAKSLVLTKLEEAYMWVGKAIRDQQIENCNDGSPQEERVNS